MSHVREVGGNSVPPPLLNLHYFVPTRHNLSEANMAKRKLHSYSLVRVGNNFMANSPMGIGNNNRLFGRRLRRRLNKRPRTISRSPSRRTIGRVRWGRRMKLERFPKTESALAETMLSTSCLNIAPKTLGHHLFTYPKENTTALMHKRNSNNIRLCNIKQYGSIINETDKYVKVMCAIVIWRDTDAGNDPDPNPNFFRDPVSDTDRTMNFVDQHVNESGTRGTDSYVNNVIRYSTFAINPEKFHILYRASKILSNKDNDRGDSTYIWHFRKSIRVNRLVGFNNPVDIGSQHVMKWVYWAEPIDVDELTSFTSGKVIDVQMQHQLIYRNVN